MNYVAITTSDKGWILEKLATELASRLPYVRIVQESDSNALINYYITYNLYKEKKSSLNVSYFTHLEPDLAERFFQVAKKMDYCVCLSEVYKNILVDKGIKNVTIIQPGVDLNTFKPKIQIGVVGRTYHTGRKGEGIIAQLMDIEYIQWHFTGDGWPGPAMHLTASELPDLYRKMDYILVPALYEGGPMCVAEALACGTEVIAPPIGWIPQFPHIEYKTGDVQDLRRVLDELYQKKLNLRSSVENVTWDNWAQKHDKLFWRLARTRGKTLAPPEEDIVSPPKIGFVLHGSEKKDKGGPSLRAPQTATMVNATGRYKGTLCWGSEFYPEQFDLAHIFNLWDLESCGKCVEAAYLNRKPIVLSTIFLDLSEIKYFKGIINLFKQYYNDEDLVLRLSQFQALRAKEIITGQRYQEAFPGHFDTIRDIVSKTDHIIFLSEHERKLFEAIDIPVPDFSIIHNPVDSEVYACADPAFFAEKYGIKDYILCVGRLEARKNQLMLAYALKDAGLPLVFIGDEGENREYVELLRQHAPQNTIFTGRMEGNSQLLASAYAGARVYCQPSWTEGASLSTLEAAASGCRMVLSNRSSEEEYFSNYASYCDPFSLESLKSSVLKAFESERSESARKEQRQYIKEKYSSHAYISKTLAAYDAVLKKKKRSQPPIPSEKIYIDMTSSAHKDGAPAGISRTEYEYATTLYNIFPNKVKFVLWNDYYRTFVPLSHDQIVDMSYKKQRSAEYVGPPQNNALPPPYGNVIFERGSIFLVPGCAWIGNSKYINDLAITARACELKLAAFIYDVIHAKLHYLYPKKVSQRFTENCEKMLEIANVIITDSQSSAADIKEFAFRYGIPYPQIIVTRLGDNIKKNDGENIPDLSQILNLIGHEPFVLYVSAIDIRKNQALLLNIWRRMILERGMEKTPHLLCVGSKGWGADEFLNMVEQDTLVGKKMHILHNMDDLALDWLYRRCLFTVYPSLYEGWGLPVAESLAYGKACVASSAASIPEICPELTDLIDPYDFKTWYERLSQYIFNPNYLKRKSEEIRKYQPYTWEEAAKDLSDIFNEYIIETRLPERCDYDKIYSYNSPELERMLAGGWGDAEESGRWSTWTISSFRFRIWMRKDCAIITLTCKSFTPVDKDHQDVEVYINGKYSQLLSIPADAISCQIFLSSCSPLNEGGEFVTFQIDFSIPNATRPCDKEKGNTDKRKLGIYLYNIKINHGAGDIELLLNANDVLNINKIYPECGSLLFTIASRRRDLIAKFLDWSHPLENLLLWAWRYGIYEMNELKSVREKLTSVFQELHSRRYKEEDANYTRLMHLVWLAREDLHEISPEIEEGRAKIYQWYIDYGMKECELEGFPPQKCQGS